MRGQVEVATTDGQVARSPSTRPTRRPARGGRGGPAEADWVVLGPGSWFTSVIPHLLVPELRSALVETGPPGASVLNLAPQAGETAGLRARGPPRAVLFEHAPDLQVDTVLADPAPRCRPTTLERAVAGRWLARWSVADVALDDGRPRHDPAILGARHAAIFEDMMTPDGVAPYVAGSAHGDDGTGEGELASTQITKTCCRKAEVASMLRFAGGLHIVSGKIVVEAELDTGRPRPPAAQGHRRGLRPPSDVVMVQGNGIRKGSRYVVRVVKDGEALARQTGLLDQRGRPVRGLPPAGRLRRRLRRRGGLAGCVPGPRLAHRARPLVVAGGHLPRPRGRAGPGRRRPAGSASRPRPARSAASTGW